MTISTKTTKQMIDEWILEGGTITQCPTRNAWGSFITADLDELDPRVNVQQEAANSNIKASVTGIVAKVKKEKGLEKFLST